jgi:hypothetical protein
MLPDLSSDSSHQAQALPDAASMVALQSPRSTVIAEAALVARFSQCANDVLGNALPLRFGNALPLLFN